MLDGFLIAMVVCAVLPALLYFINLRLYLPPPSVSAFHEDGLVRVSVLIPARDEESAIGAAVASVLRSTGVEFELIVMDDNSTDQTAAVVRQIAATDDRVRLEQAAPLRTGWNGKQSACWALAQAAQYELMCFLDADVRVGPEALARMAAFLTQRDAALVSGFPLEETRTWMEWLLLPLIHFVLLGFLPISRMRSGTNPSLAAGCGQFMLVRRDAYLECGGHAAIRSTMHDGLLLPRLFRQRGYRTDLADLTGLAVCRMYRNAREVWYGLTKNATEGIGNPTRILPITLLLVLGQVLPFVLVLWLALNREASGTVWLLTLVGISAAWLPRLSATVRFRQNWRSCLLHPLGIVLLLAIQWYALAQKLLGYSTSWKQRAYVRE